MVKIVTRLGKLATLGLAAVMLTGVQSRTGGFESRMVSAHNYERAALGVGPVRWNDSLAAGAQEWADHLSATGQFAHSPDEKGGPQIGENIWGGTKGHFSLESMVHLWIAEKQHFVPGTFPHTSATGNPADVSHYTQLVWRDTVEIGCGLSGAGGEEILVCRYSRPGNVVGQEVY